jgi:hypothetical protein
LGRESSENSPRAVPRFNGRETQGPPQTHTIRELGIRGIAGNYDSATATDYPHCGCKAEGPRAEELSHLSYGGTREHVSPETKKFLGVLPFRMDLRPRGGHKSRPTLTLVHGTPTLNTLY